MLATVMTLIAAMAPSPPPTRPATPSAEFNGTVRQLTERLTNDNPSVKQKAELELLALGPPATEQLLATAALTREQPLKNAIVDLLPRYGPEAIERLLWGPGWDVRVYRGDSGIDDPIKEMAVNAIVGMGAAALPEVRRLTEVGLRGAVAALSRLGPAATGTIVDLLQHHSDDRMRISMVTILEDSLDPEAADALLKALHDENISIRRHAANGVGNLRDRRGMGRLVEMLKSDPGPQARMAAAVALGKIYEPRLFKPLSRAAQWDSDWDVRKTASSVLIRWTYDPVAIRVGERYYPPRMTEAVIDVTYTRIALLLVASGMLVYLLIWFARSGSQTEIWRGLSTRATVAAVLTVVFGFGWGFWMIRVWGLVELLLLLLVLPATAFLAWRTGARLKSLRGSALGCALGVALVFLGARSSMWVSLGLEWLAPRLLVLIVVMSVLIGVLRRRTLDAALLASVRRAALVCAGAFYMGYGIGWLALWGYLGF